MSELTEIEETVLRQYEQREAAHRAEAEHHARLAEMMRRAGESIRANPIGDVTLPDNPEFDVDDEEGE